MISFEDYKRHLFEGTTIHRGQLLFRSKKHITNTIGEIITNNLKFKIGELE